MDNIINSKTAFILNSESQNHHLGGSVSNSGKSLWESLSQLKLEKKLVGQDLDSKIARPERLDHIGANIQHTKKIRGPLYL